MKYCFGVDIGGTTVKMGLFEATGTILEKWEIKTHTEEGGKGNPSGCCCITQGEKSRA